MDEPGDDTPWRLTDMILNRCDAWETNSVEKMKAWAENNGYSIINAEITFMGDMIIWVE